MTPEAHVTREGGAPEASEETASPPRRGLDWSTARQRICQVCDDATSAEILRLRQGSLNFIFVAKDALLSQGALLGCVTVLVIGEALEEHSHDDSGNGEVAKWIYRGILVVNVILNVWIVAARQICQQRELLGRVRESVETYRESVLTAADDEYASVRRHHAILKQGSPMLSIYPVFRDNQWQRVPGLLLVEEDIIALCAGDSTPAEVEELDLESTEKREHHSRNVEEGPHHPFLASTPAQGKPEVLPAGSKVGMRPDRQTSFLRKSALSPVSQRLLVLCRDMRCFRLRATPMKAFLEEMLRPDRAGSPPDTLFAKDMRISRSAAKYGVLALMLILLVAASVRFLWQEQEKTSWAHFLLVEPACLAILALPVARPALSLLAEALSIARLLTVVEDLHLAQWQGDWGAQRKGEAEADLEPERRIRLKSARRDRMPVRRFMRYASATLRARLLPVPLLQPPTRSAAAQHVPVTITGGHQGAKLQRRRALLPIPLIQSKTVERLGAVTMLGVIDDELLVSDTSSPEAVFLLNSKKTQETSTSTVLQMVREPLLDPPPEILPATTLPTVKFEDPGWTQHLASLKPVGFCSLALVEAEARRGESLRDHARGGCPGLVDPGQALVDFVLEDAPCHRRAYLAQLAHGIGFSASDDLRPFFKGRGRLQVVASHRVEEQTSEDNRASSLEETRSRGMLQPYMTSAVWEDVRRRGGTGDEADFDASAVASSGGMQLFSEGAPTPALSRCVDYWNGKVISNLTTEDRRLIISTWKAWTLDGFHVVCLSYTPLPHHHRGLFAQGKVEDPPTYLVDDYHRPDEMAHVDAVQEEAMTESEAKMSPHGPTGVQEDDEIEKDRPNSWEDRVDDAARWAERAILSKTRPPQYTPESPSEYIGASQNVQSPLPSSKDQHGHKIDRDTETGALRDFPHVSISMPDLLRGSTEPTPLAGTENLSSANIKVSYGCASEIRNASKRRKGGGVKAEATFDSQAREDGLLWILLRRQVFLGLVASSVLPRNEMPGFVEEMMASGVRFLFFSPRNMRRSKKLAEQMGITMDWNAAISLRPSVVTVPKSHLIVGRGDVYGDWAIKSRLPHGCAAIREHLHKVDNVPLLVSVYTDATPPTIDEMFLVFQDHHESVLCVGCGFRSTNAQLFRRADVAISVGGLPGGLKGSPTACTSPTESPVDMSRKHVPAPCDAAFNESMVGLFTVLRLEATDNGTTVSLAVLTNVVKESRRLLGCFYQCISLGTTILCTSALLLILPHLLPFPVGSTRGRWSLADTLWVLWIVLPLLVLPLLVTPADAGLLERYPRKNVIRPFDHSILRTTRALLVRCLPTVALCMYAHARCLVSLLVQFSDVVNACHVKGAPHASVSTAWAQFGALLACQEQSALFREGHTEVTASYVVAHDLLLLALACSLFAQSSTFLHGTASLREESPLRNIAWIIGGTCLVAGQACHFIVRGLTLVKGKGLSAIGWDVWVVALIFAPLASLTLSEIIKKADAKILIKHARFRRLEFATRLGMHSPK
ncbi:hypothetical protein Naga_100029g7 [Nannochloropsis gaditana]|uniref:Cation-transporting P-type ATPase C-terminal domain-containing protein n=1 Tax=Nannochloropsis gaditana TaxID=72520 RepID=W7U8K3_9STRA|nr:hypothetical protein Naga_100029g7 [Nannochloropsis gaditana]